MKCSQVLSFYTNIYTSLAVKDTDSAGGLRNKKNRMRKHLKTADSFVFVLACFLFALLTHCFEKHFMQMPTKNTFSGPTRNRVQKIMEKY